MADPVVMPAWMPEASRSWWWYVDNSAWMRKRDFILMDVRGTGLAVPNLDCPEMDRGSAGADGESHGFAGWIDELLRNSDVCRDRLIGAGRQLAAYNSKSAAGDIVDLMTVAGIESMNIYGASYGTRIAFSLLRDHPQRVRSLVLEVVAAAQRGSGDPAAGRIRPSDRPYRGGLRS